MTAASIDVGQLAAGLARLGAVRFGQFTLKDGSVSPVYLDLRLLVSDPILLALAARAYGGLLADLPHDRIAGIPYAGLPLATAVALATGTPMIYPRKETKDYGTRRPVEGLYTPGETVAVLDDVISSGASKLDAVRTLESAGLVVRDIVVLVDRQGPGRADLAAHGYRLHAVTTLSALAAALAAADLIPREAAVAVADYVAGPGGARG